MTIPIRIRIVLLPAIAVLGLACSIGVMQLMGARLEAHLSRLDEQYLPAQDLARDLTSTLGRVQRGLQDAVAAQDEDALVATDAAVAELQARLEKARVPLAATLDAKALGEQLGRYYVDARVTTLALVRQEQLPDRAQRLAAMATGFHQLEEAFGTLALQTRAVMATAVAQARENASRTRSLMTAVLVLVTVLLAGVALWLGQSLLRPLEALRSAAERIATDGDLAQEIRVYADDELGLVATAFRAMLARLRFVPTTVGRGVSQLAAAVAALDSLAQTQRQLVARQATRLLEIASTNDELRAVSTAASRQATGVLESAQAAEGLSVSGAGAAADGAESLREIAAQVEAMAAKVRALGKSAGEVQDLVQVVGDVAVQSNLLALNAALEAVRAGDAGRGFAVVAREMRSMADKSAGTSRKAGTVLEQMQLSMAAADAETRSGVERVGVAIERVRESSRAFVAVADGLKTSSQNARQIVAAVGQQHAGISQLGTALAELRGLGDEVLETSRKTREAELSVREAATELDTMVRGFLV